MEEKLYPIPGFEDYFITENGKVMGRKKCQSNPNQELRENRPYLRKGYLTVKLRKGKERKSYFIHRLVAKTFIPNPDNLPCVNHKDRNPLNNNYRNLEWCTVDYNNLYIAFYGDRVKRHTCRAYRGDELIDSFCSVLAAADYIVENYKVSHPDGLSASLEARGDDGVLFRIVRDGKDTFDWNAKLNKRYEDYQSKNIKIHRGQPCQIMKGDEIIKTFRSKVIMNSWIRRNLKIPISYIIKYGKYEDYHVETIQESLQTIQE